MMNNVILTCSPLVFYTQNDEDLLFEWIKKIKSISRFEGVERELKLYVSSKKIPNGDLLDLMGVFDRYGFDKEQLKIFMNETNKDWFE